MNERLRKEVFIIEELFQIADKEGNDVPMKLNTAQQKLVSRLTGRDLVPKARQEGVSSLILALFTVRCLYKRNTRAVVISHDQASTERLFSRVKYYLDNFKGPPPVLEFASKRELTFPKTNSVFYIGTAGTRKFGRGDTITDLHCSEIAFWENPKDLFSGLSDAVPIKGGTIILESTGNGKNWYYQQVCDGRDGKSPYIVHFLDWLSFPEYDLPVTAEEVEKIVDSLDPELEEDILYYDYGLTPGQIKFRRWKLSEKRWDLDLFRQEYPMSLEECFRSTGHSLFHKVNFVVSPRWQKIGPHMWGLPEHPRPEYHYIIGGDPSAGVGKDNSVFEIFCVETGQQVVEWVYDRLGPDVYGERAAALGREYNGAFIVIERNNHGLTTLKVLRDIYPKRLIFREGYGRDMLMSSGFSTSNRQKKEWAVGLLRANLAECFTIFSPDLKSELDTFIEKEDGRLEAEGGYKDDRVMAAVMASIGLGRSGRIFLEKPQPVITVKDPFTLDAIIEELGNRNKRFPIPPQASMEPNTRLE